MCSRPRNGDDFREKLIFIYLRSDLLGNYDFRSNSERSHNIPMAHFPSELFQPGPTMIGRHPPVSIGEN